MKLPADFQVQTERMVLRQLSKEDAPFVWSASRFPEFTKGMLWDPPETMEEIYTWTTGALQLWKKGTDFTFTMQRIEDAVFLGRITLRKREQKGEWGIGYWLHPNYWGKGYMSEACRAVIGIGFRELDAAYITSQFATWNSKSGKVLERAGMTYVRDIEKGFQKHGEWVPEQEYGIAREQWNEVSN